MKLLEQILDFIAPLECMICGAEGDVLCPACAESELIKAYSCCFGCSKLTKNFQTCPKCIPKVNLKSVWIAHDYTDIPKNIIQEYKYGSSRAIVRFISSSMMEVLPDFDFLVTSVPTDAQRVRSRGFDHAVLIGKTIASKKCLTFSTLLRRISSAHQVGASRAQRLEQTSGLFEHVSSSKIKGKNILLIDDVATTGATLINASKALKKAGAKSVYGLVFARKM